MKLRAGLLPAFGLVLLSALWAFGWLLPDLLPQSGGRAVSLPLGEAILFSAFAATSAFIAKMQQLEFPRGRRAWIGAGIGVGLFVVPGCAAAFARGWVSNFDAVAVFCLTPVFAVVLEPYLQDNPPRKGKAALAGALVAIAGILCLLPLETPGSFRAGAALVVLLMAAFVVAATNCVAVRVASTVPGPSSLTLAAQAGGASAILFAAIAGVTRSAEGDSSGLTIYLLRLFLVDLPGLFVLFWLMRRLSAARMTARFLVAPLLASLASLALERTLPPLRGLLGLVLVAAGSGWLVFAPAEPDREARFTLSADPGESQDW
jgi:drug/metabolite transporter (DMT)-like permease